MAKDQMKITITAAQGCGKTTLGNAIERFIRTNWPRKSIARFNGGRQDPNINYSNCDVIIIEKQAIPE